MGEQEKEKIKYRQIQFTLFKINFEYRIKFIMKSDIRRCLTPTEHKKKKFLHELLTVKPSPTKPISYDSFIYADRLTNHKIVIGEARKSYDPSKRKGKNENRSRYSKKIVLPEKKKEMEEINECLSLIKTTKMFQKATLKNKIFKNSQEAEKEQTNKDQLKDLLSKKKNLRELFNKEVKDIIMREFRNYFEGKKINPKIMHLTKHIPQQINKHNISKIIDEFIQPKNQSTKEKKAKVSQKEFKFPNEKQMLSLWIDHLHLKMKQYEYLVSPPKQKELYEKIHRSKLKKKVFHYNTTDINDFSFQQFKENQQIQTIREEKKRNQKKLTYKEKQIIFTIQNGDILTLISLLVLDPTLLYTKDQKQNNLLHMAAKKDQLQIFDLLVKKLGKKALQQRNKFGKTPMDLAALFGGQKIEKAYEEQQNYIF